MNYLYIRLSTHSDYSHKKDSFTDFVRTTFPSTIQPIHYMHMSRVGGLDYEILTELVPSLLKQVRFLKFEFNKKASWIGASLNSLINTLKNDAGLICYWSGDADTDNSLWRITDCFLDHYGKHQFARIACVSKIHEDVRELAIQMENKFLQLLDES